MKELKNLPTKLFGVILSIDSVLSVSLLSKMVMSIEDKTPNRLNLNLRNFVSFIHCTEVLFGNFFSSRFTTMIVISPPESKLAKCTYSCALSVPRNYGSFDFN